MRHFFRRGVLALLTTILLFFSAFPVKSSSAPEGISAESAALICGETGQVIWEKEGNKRLSMASTTKIMTALLALEAAQEKKDPIVSITEEMVAVEGSSMGLQVGDEISLRNLAAGMLLASGNDAANAAALYLAGSQEDFAEQMNARAKKIGLENTHFVTPSGLDAEGHYSTALDMAKLAQEALKNQWFQKLSSSQTCQVRFQIPEKTVSYENHNKLLRLYEGCIGVKTGFTKKSGRCLVSAAYRDGVTLIAVTLSAPDDWNDHCLLLDYGFSVLEPVSFDGRDFSCSVPLAGGTKDDIKVQGLTGEELPLFSEEAEKITKRVFLPRFVYAPLKKGEALGKIVYYLDGTEIFSVPVAAQESVESIQKEKDGIWKKIFGPR